MAARSSDGGEATAPAEPKVGYGFKKWDAVSPPQEQRLSAYEQKMMKRLERANRLARVQATGQAAPGESEDPAVFSVASVKKALPPPPAKGADHEKLAFLAQQSRERGQPMFYFPSGGPQLKDDALQLNQTVREEERQNEELRERNKDNPEREIFDFMDRLEAIQLEARAERIQAGEIEDPWKRSSTAAPLSSSAGRKHEVVVDNGSDEECERDPSACASQAPQSSELEPASVPKTADESAVVAPLQASPPSEALSSSTSQQASSPEAAPLQAMPAQKPRRGPNAKIAF